MESGRPRILLVEDDEALRHVLEGALRNAGFEVRIARDGAAASRALEDGAAIDVVLLDIGLPFVNGWHVLRSLPTADAPGVIVISARGDKDDKVRALDLGADDYMAKPFALSELEARVRALTRRGMGATSSTIKHGPLVYDQAGRVATIDGKMVELSARELGLLEVLLQRAGRLVSKDQLVERLCEWGEEVSNNAIEVYIHRLRKKIEKGPIRIATVRGLGYCLEKIP